jgi:formylglycine-generating enzyme required for sulfatase activity
LVAPPEPEEKKKEGPAASPKKKRKRKEPSKEEASSAPRGVLFEETPVLDTVEARRTVRLVTGSIATLLVLIFGFVLFRILTAKPALKQSPEAEKVEIVDVYKVKQHGETEAETLFERAHEVARRGNHEQAIRMLKRVSDAYPETGAADAAREALARSSQHLPLFPDSPAPAVPAGSGGTSTGVVAGNRQSTAGATPGEQGPVAASPEEALAAMTPTNIARSKSDTPLNANRAMLAASDPPPVRALPSGVQARTGAGVDPSGWPLEIVSSRDRAMMVLVPGGPVVMGRDVADTTEAPAHLVKVATFYIDKHEVTNRQFEMFLKETRPLPERGQALAREAGRVSLSEDSPVVMVNAREARAYADWAGKQLPTEAQWEKAARGTDQRPYPWGVAAPVWVKPREPLQVDTVMSFPNDLSPYGAYDLAGNVIEWTRDWYDPNLYASQRGITAEDPTGPSSRPPSAEVAVRGNSRQWRITARAGMVEGTRLPYLGFRCVLPVEGPDSLLPRTAVPKAAPPGSGPGGAAKSGAVPF